MVKCIAKKSQIHTQPYWQLATNNWQLTTDYFFSHSHSMVLGGLEEMS